MYHTITNVQNSEAIQLQRCIDNRDSNLCVGLRSINYTVGWYNFEEIETISWRAEGDETGIHFYNFKPGIYAFTQFRNIIKGRSGFSINVELGVSRQDGLLTLRIPRGWQLKFTDRLLNLMGLDDGLGGQWLDPGNYTGDRPVDFTPIKNLHVHLEQISDANNNLNGAPSTVLAVVPTIKPNTHITTPPRMGDMKSERFEQPEFKCLTVGCITELKVVITDENGRPLNNHGLPISVVLEFRNVHATSIQQYNEAT